GLPIVAMVAWRRWRETQTNLLWRFIICIVFACVVAPAIMQEDDWGNPRLIDIFPAIRMPLMLVLAVFSGQVQSHDWHDWLNLFCMMLWFGAFPVFVVATTS